MTECISDANNVIPFVVMFFVFYSIFLTLAWRQHYINTSSFDYVLRTQMQRSSYLSEAVPYQQYFILIHAIAISKNKINRPYIKLGRGFSQVFDIDDFAIAICISRHQ